MEIIILAAGQSKRLKKHTQDQPKCLIEIVGKTILERQLNVINNTDASKCIIVAGFKSDKIVEFINDNHHKYNFKIEVVYNALFESTDNAYSLAIGLDKSIGPVIILDGDIVFENNLFKNLYYNKYDNVLLCDNSRAPEVEDCKILESGGYATRMGKRVSGQSIYTSMIKLGGRVLSDFIEEINRDRQTKEWYSEPLDRILKENNKSVNIIYTGKYYRTEIDTEDDLIQAEKEIIKRGI